MLYIFGLLKKYLFLQKGFFSNPFELHIGHPKCCIYVHFHMFTEEILLWHLLVFSVDTDHLSGENSPIL